MVIVPDRTDSPPMNDAFEYDPARDDELILVDENDGETGTATKERVHLEGLLHRAFSVVLMRGEGDSREFLIARRAYAKYHSGGLWANSCCSHPRAGEDLLDAAERRVREELGCEVGELRKLGSFIYRTEFDDGLVENEIDHVLVGEIVGTPVPNPDEIAELRWIAPEDLRAMLAQTPGRFAPWAPRVFEFLI